MPALCCRRGKRSSSASATPATRADFGQFSEALDKHPALIQTFRTWGSDFPESIERWQEARARPVLHFTTADNNDGHELISPRAIAQGFGDDYLIRLNRLFWEKEMRAYIRPLGEPNRCLNVYASYDCDGNPRDAAHKPRWYKLAFRRIYVVLHGGGQSGEIDARLRAAGLPPLRSDARRPAEGADRGPLEHAARRLAHRAPQPTTPLLPRRRWVDWVGTDLYSDNQDWKALAGLYRRFSNKPFALPEWGVSGGDDPAYVRKLMTWVQRHRRCKMLVYYQDFGSTSSYRIQNYPASLAVLQQRSTIASAFPPFAPDPPEAPPPPPGGVAPTP